MLYNHILELLILISFIQPISIVASDPGDQVPSAMQPIVEVEDPLDHLQDLVNDLYESLLQEVPATDSDTLKDLESFEHHIIMTKKIIPEDAIVLIKGDLHGDDETIRALIANLHKKKLINQGQKLNKNVFLVFLGDYIDRGPNSVEVLYQITTLKKRNPEQVFLLRGNHETIPLLLNKQNKKIKDQLVEQLFRIPSKYRNSPGEHDKKIAAILHKLNQAFSLMPQLLFIGYEDALLKKNHYFACLHGGLPHQPNLANYGNQRNAAQKLQGDQTCLKDHTENIRDLLSSPFITSSISTLDLFSTKVTDFYFLSPYLWNDFLPIKEEKLDQITTPSSRGLHIKALGKLDTLEWIKNISTKDSPVYFIVRGHQQSPRNLFEKKGQEGLANRWNGRVFTLDYSPRVSGFSAQHDIYLSIQPKPGKNPYFTIELLRLPLTK